MITAVGEPPRTYQQWLDCLDHLRSGREERAVLLLLADGTMPLMNERVLDAFLKRTDETVRAMMQRRTNQFLLRLDQLLEDGDWDGAELLARRFQAVFEECFFFESLRFLPEPERNHLSDGYRAQLKSFWARLIDGMLQEAQDPFCAALEDLAVSIRRMSGRRMREQVEV